MGHLKSAKNKCLWSSVEKTAEAFTCCRKKYLFSSKNRSNLYMICSHSVKNFWVIICALCIGMRSQMLYTNGSFEICQDRMFAKQRRRHGWSSYLPGKNIFVPKQKSSNLYIVMFEVGENVSEYVFMHSALVCVHKCFTLTGGLKSAKCECLWSSAEHTAEAVTCQGKIYLSHSKNRQIST